MVVKLPARAAWGAHGSEPPRRFALFSHATLRDVAVGIVASDRGIEPLTTFVVKRSWTFDPESGELSPHAAVLGVGAPGRHPVDHPDALDASSDFAPWKVAADVLVVGTASFASPTSSMPVVIEAGGRRVERKLRAGAEASALPLALPYLGGERVGPSRAFTPTGGEYFGDTPDDAFQAAAPDLRLPLGALERDGSLALRGLLPRSGDHPLVLQLPTARPLLRVIDIRGTERGLDLALDTVLVDLDARRVDLVHRATESGRPAHRVVLDGFRDGGLPPDASIGRPHAEYALSAVTTEDDARVEREPALDATDRQIALADAVSGASPEPRMELDRYAEIHADLAERPRHRTEVLREHGLAETGWLVEERAWLERMAADAMRGDPGVATAFGALFVEAQDALVTPRETDMPLDEYARIAVIFDHAEEPIEALAGEKLTLAQWMRLGRIWAERVDGDAAVEHALTRALQRERARAGTEG